jgi:hypothetical protein
MGVHAGVLRLFEAGQGGQGEEVQEEMSCGGLGCDFGCQVECNVFCSSAADTCLTNTTLTV